MTQTIRHRVLSVRDLLATAGPLIVLAIVLLAVAYWFLEPAPPRRLVMATGSERGAYAEFGVRYASMLAREGVTVELRHTQGSVDNLALLRDPESGVDVAFVQGGVETPKDHDDPVNEGLVSLGSLFYEPVWLFYREESARRLLRAPKAGPRPSAPPANGPSSLEKSPTLTRVSQLKGWRINADTEGSGVRAMVNQLLEVNAVDPHSLTLLGESTTPAVVSFLEGRTDAIVFVSAPESLMVQMLLRTPGVKLFDFPQAEAYSRRFAFLSPVTLPRGTIDLASDHPSRDVRLVAPTAMMVAREGTHPALMQLLVQAAAQIHGGPGWFRHKGDFPNTRNTSLPIASEAARFYRDGLPWLQRYMPFWMANLVGRMWVMLIAIIAVLIPLSRIVPPLYQFRVRSRVFRWYGQLRALEESVGRRPSDELNQELDEIDRKVGLVRVPLSYADELYSLRSHIGMVRGRLARQP
ncbi:MAG TPA: TAXI family TRAP transporter solute-binding subunit [Burkholderiaceae bacterium]